MTRGRWQGMVSIARFNWPFYLAAALVLAAGFVGIVITSENWLRVGMVIAVVGSGYFLFVSLGVSHLIYDRSDLYRWGWLDRALGEKDCQRAIFCHAGFDEASAALRERTGSAEWIVLDHFDAATMTEASVRRARSLYPPVPGTLAARHDTWPVEDGWADAVFGILAIHELRSVAERAVWFAEAKRCLAASGRIIVVEHVRDGANFLAFGLGFLHFHSVEKWKRSWETAGLRQTDGFRITPWVRVFTLTHS